MRLPTITNASARESADDIDQEMVNKQVDYALANGVNFFDTSPAYCKGKSENAMGVMIVFALRHASPADRAKLMKMMTPIFGDARAGRGNPVTNDIVLY